MERVVGGGESNEPMPAHPSLAMHALIAKLGNFIPHSPKDVTVMQRRLIRAGNRRAVHGATRDSGRCVMLRTR